MKKEPLSTVGVVPSDEEEREMGERLKTARQQGDAEEIEKEIVVRNYPLAINIAKKYLRQYRASQTKGREPEKCRAHMVELHDLAQTASVGLMKAVKFWDPDKGKFSTVAQRRAQWEFQRHYRSMISVVYIPECRWDQRSKLMKAVRRLYERGNPAPTKDDIAEEAGMSEKVVSEVMNMFRLSFNGPALDGAYHPRTPPHDSPSARLSAAEEQELIRRLVSNLPLRSAKIIAMRFGLWGEPPKTIEEIGVVIGITKQWVWEIIKRACTEMKYELKSLDLGLYQCYNT